MKVADMDWLLDPYVAAGIRYFEFKEAAASCALRFRIAQPRPRHMPDVVSSQAL